ncbi:biotin transporter BioY [Pyrococcus abyssi]|uniref:BioY biotin biosynthesis protein n=1 Tax=Pyrococcus abyssi (strain GE5 / Orsay) TaxID=272844 RepID=Q9V2B9_PYRAB|nr:biotin transporter BioY [Pyrococcus abyssi]CAB49079.1 bioY biotin biosynthesis protein [Pyrococcus abyssi GE5]CCE69531.1 TPA: biotin synthase, putative [Pyrococcus abyssi GE5]
MKAKEVSLVALFTALTAVGAQISISIGPVPLTLQVLFVVLAGLVLGPRLGFLSMLLYDVLGMLGFPVFAGFSGGIAHILGPTGGYIVAFPIASLIAGLGKGKVKYLTSLASLGVIYSLGWLRLSSFIGAEKALKVGVLPFILPDIVKILVAIAIVNRLNIRRP